MPQVPDSAQPKTARVTIRLEPEEKRLLEEYADIRGETLTDILRQMGAKEAVALARKVTARLAS